MLRLLLILTLYAAPALATAAGGTYKWVDEKGVTHYSDILPPAAVDRGTTTLNQHAVPVETVPPAPTPEQRRAAAADAVRRAEQQKEADEQKRKDMVLLDVYSDASEIDRVRDRNLDLVEGRIKVLREKLKQAKKMQDEYNNQLEFYRGRDAAGKQRKPPGDLTQNMDDNLGEQHLLAEQIERLQQEYEAVRLRFEQEKRHYLQVKAAYDSRKPGDRATD